MQHQALSRQGSNQWNADKPQRQSPPPTQKRIEVENLERHQRSLGISKVWRQDNGAFLPHSKELDVKMQNEEAAAAISEHSITGSLKLPLSEVIEFYNTDYQNVNVPQNSVVYCDIPYYNTTKYRHKSKNINFDYERFYQWCENATFPVFISEYWMPEDRFKCIAEIKRTSTVCATNNNFKVVEKLFIPINQEHKTYQQLKLF